MSIEQQQEAIEKWAAAAGDEIEFSFSDAALTGTDMERPGLWEAIGKLKRGWALVVFKFDRLSRNAFDAVFIERAVLKKGAVIISASGEGTIDKGLSAEEALKFGLLRLFAEYEAKMISIRTSTAMRHHQRVGRRMSSNAPYGWSYDPQDRKHMIPDEEEQKAIALMVEMKAGGNGVRKIARVLNEGKMLARTGHWYESTIARILRREGEK